MQFDSLGLRAELLRAVDALGFKTATPIQHQAIPAILDGRDVMASARTGTGKTAAFALPVLQHLATRPARGNGVRALILAPTRELAAQVRDNLRELGRFTPVRSTVVFGGVNIKPQIGKLRGGIDVLVATPGRLLDHVQRGTADLSGVEILVLDEADRMLDMGFLPDIERIIKKLPQSRQTLLFSATFPPAIIALAGRFLREPARIETAPPNSTVEAIAQQAIRVDQSRKRALLAWMIGHHNWRQVLVFTRTKHGANRLARQLADDGIRAEAIHGNKSQGARTRSLADFKNSRLRVLVATDIAARGLDIDQLPQVVNYDIPHVPEDYVHRIGRTGRAGRSGLALSLISPADHKLFEAVRRLVRTAIPTGIIEGYEPATPAPRPVARPAAAAQRGSRRQGPPRKARTTQSSGKHSGRQRRFRKAA